MSEAGAAFLRLRSRKICGCFSSACPFEPLGFMHFRQVYLSTSPESWKLFPSPQIQFADNYPLPAHNHLRVGFSPVRPDIQKL